MTETLAQSSRHETSPQSSYYMRIDFLDLVNRLETVHTTVDGDSIWIGVSPNGDGAFTIQIDAKRSIHIEQTREQFERIYRILQKRLFE